ncbi:hypothetical protein BG011_008970 [Mortierella polycephala]|uniref:L-ornithine N(5)-oxygenase n=1 Tax=Mortierella polycephala TaxID=41804 RepID=A0A9P6PP62_9FUNG|nr:hypothetical protein BG011_008970 [Mortierella polycephala]
MELPLYSFTDFVHDHPEHGKNLDRPLRSTVSAYYKAYVKQTGIASSFSNYTTVTGIYHLKDLDNHCCCALDPQTGHNHKKTPHMEGMKASAPTTSTSSTSVCRECASYRYAVLGYVEETTTKTRTKFLTRCKTVVLATGTFDQPKKLPAVGAQPCAPPTCPTKMIQQTFHDTRQLEEWMNRHDVRHPLSVSKSACRMSPMATVSPPHSPSTLSCNTTTTATTTTPPSPVVDESPTLPIVIVGTGLSAADAILLIQEKQPWRRIIHIYKYFSSSEPSPLKRCHRDVYPEYASIWVKMKKFATLKNSVQSYQHQKNEDGSCSVFSKDPSTSAVSCADCQSVSLNGNVTDEKSAPLCSTCSYKGLPDASVSSWDPVSGEIIIILNYGVVIKERVAAVGVFIGKQVHMGFLKGSLAQELLSNGDHALGSPSIPKDLSMGISRSRRRIGGGRRGTDRSSSVKDVEVDIPTPPCTPPRSPVLRPRHHTWHKQAIDRVKQLGCRNLQTPVQGTSDKVQQGKEDTGRNSTSDEDAQKQVAEGEEDEEQDGQEEEEEEEEEEVVEQYQVLTLLRPLVSDMYSFKIIPSNTSTESQLDATTTTSLSVTPVASPAYPTRAKKCTRLPHYPVRTPCVPAATCSSLSSDESGDAAADVDSGSGSRPVCEGAGRSIKGSNSATSCISMPCSPLLGCKISNPAPTLPTPPFFALCSAAASVLTSSLASLSAPCASLSSKSLPSSPLFTSPSTPLSASTSTSSLVSEHCICATDGCCAPPSSSSSSSSSPLEGEELEPVPQPLMDQSIYAAGAITGSKFVRYVLGNGVAIVADILKHEII